MHLAAVLSVLMLMLVPGCRLSTSRIPCSCALLCLALDIVTIMLAAVVLALMMMMMMMLFSLHIYYSYLPRHGSYIFIDISCSNSLAIDA
eukprot:m.194469 g.194469  ORF g.194469 m.194469 type:complete len:90 (-) comp10075_c2_seq2:387-656(-)